MSPFDFGAIAAVNSLSDIYAMGGKPLFALNIVGFPSNRLPIAVLNEILLGAQHIAEKAGINIIGGHSIEDTEPKFGWSVTGIVHPNKVVKNSTACVGDTLILTKLIGTGILSTALKQNLLNDKLKKHLKEVMMELNKKSSESMMEVGINACTDITGFGLIGHLLEMVNGSKTSAIIFSDRIPILNGVVELIAAGIIPGGTKNNYEHSLAQVNYAENISMTKKMYLNDAPTSGGLLIAAASNKTERLIDLLNKNSVECCEVVGKITTIGEKRIRIE